MTFKITRREYKLLLSAFYNGYENVYTLSQAHEAQYPELNGGKKETKNSLKHERHAKAILKLRDKIASQAIPPRD